MIPHAEMRSARAVQVVGPVRQHAAHLSESDSPSPQLQGRRPGLKAPFFPFVSQSQSAEFCHHVFQVLTIKHDMTNQPATEISTSFVTSYCNSFWRSYNHYVLLRGNFGDWATPKKSMAGHFFGNQQGEGFSLQ
jgi:hypothetical protein